MINQEISCLFNNQNRLRITNKSRSYFEGPQPRHSLRQPLILPIPVVSQNLRVNNLTPGQKFEFSHLLWIQSAQLQQQPGLVEEKLLNRFLSPNINYDIEDNPLVLCGRTDNQKRKYLLQQQSQLILNVRCSPPLLVVDVLLN